MPFPIDENYVSQTEEKLGVTFPQAFREKMMAENGGEVKTPADAWQLHPFFDASDKKRLKRTCNDIVRETCAAREWRGFPDGAVAIGSNGGGDLLILMPSENGQALQQTVFWWDHETGAVSKVADSFDSLGEM